LTRRQALAEPLADSTLHAVACPNLRRSIAPITPAVEPSRVGDMVDALRPVELPIVVMVNWTAALEQSGQSRER
jgi:hypothetical protein